MANISNLSSFLTDVADAIREKKGTQDQIPAENFDTEIKSIETGTKINNQDKDITKNGTYTADEGYTGLGTVVVNVPIKLFKTKEEMDNSTGNKEGDLAVVYINKWQNVFDGIYIYKNNNWELAPTQLTATPNYVYKQSFYGKNGVKKGTLGTPNKLFDDTNAEVYSKIQNQYENMEPRILTDNDRAISTNIYFIPVKRDGTPLLDTSNVTNINYMFYPCENLTSIPLLNTSNVTNMEGMFRECTHLTTIPLLDTSKVTNMSYMFFKCIYLTSIPLLNTSKVTNMGSMFDECTHLTTIPLLDTSNVTNMSSMFDGCTNLTTIPLLDTSNVTNMSSMFYGCKNLTTIPELNTSNVTRMNRIFVSCSNLTTIPLLDTSNVTDMAYMFSDCKNLTTIPELNTSNVTDMAYMFSDCTHLTTIPELNTSNVTNMTYMFNECTRLTTIPLLDTSNVTNMDHMFAYCKNLTTIPELNTSKVTNMNRIFVSCSNLTDDSLNNIMQMCIGAIKYTGTKTLKEIGLTSEQANKCKTLSNYSAFIAAGWTTGY